MNTHTKYFGCIEAGGTKFVLGIADEKGTIIDRTRIPTETPAKTLQATIDWFSAREKLASVGIASFGPCSLTQGTILNTPKPGWSGTRLTERISEALDCPVGFDTDVNAAAMAELHLAAPDECKSLFYVTIGTGIGGGMAWRDYRPEVDSHPEIGHMFVKRHPKDNFEGICPFHGDCLEGLASGPAISGRWGADMSSAALPDEAQEIISYYLAQLVITIQASVHPDQIVLGGGVMNTTGLLDLIRSQTHDISAGYWPTDFSEMVIAPRLEQNSGLMGAYLLARQAL